MKIRMLRSEPVMLPNGAVWFHAGQEYPDVDEKTSSSLIGRGLAIQVLNGNHNEIVSRESLTDKTVQELKSMAEQAKIPGFKLLRKDDLIEALCPSAE